MRVAHQLAQIFLLWFHSFLSAVWLEFLFHSFCQHSRKIVDSGEETETQSESRPRHFNRINTIFVNDQLYGGIHRLTTVDAPCISLVIA